MTTIERAINCFETQKAFAKQMGVSQMAVIKWRKSQVPAERCLQIEKITNGEVSVHELRPDVFGPASKSDAA